MFRKTAINIMICMVQSISNLFYMLISMCFIIGASQETYDFDILCFLLSVAAWVIEALMLKLISRMKNKVSIIICLIANVIGALPNIIFLGFSPSSIELWIMLFVNIIVHVVMYLYIWIINISNKEVVKQ